MIELYIDGEPVPRAERLGYRRIIDIRALEKERIGREIQSQYSGKLLNQALRVDYLFYLTMPQNLSKSKKEKLLLQRPIKRPDCSNLVKLIEDVMTGLIYEDDKLIVSGEFNKYWSHSGYTVLKIRTLSEYQASI